MIKNLTKTFINLVNDEILDGTKDFNEVGFHLMKFDVGTDGSLENLSEVSLDENGNPQEIDC